MTPTGRSQATGRSPDIEILSRYRPPRRDPSLPVDHGRGRVDHGPSCRFAHAGRLDRLPLRSARRPPGRTHQDAPHRWPRIHGAADHSHRPIADAWKRKLVYQTYRPLLDALVQRGADVQEVEDAAAEAERSGRSIRDVLINDSVVTEMELTEAYAEASGIGDRRPRRLRRRPGRAREDPAVARAAAPGARHRHGRRRAHRRDQRPRRRAGPRRRPRRDRHAGASRRRGAQRAAPDDRAGQAQREHPRRPQRRHRGRRGGRQPHRRRRGRADRALRELTARAGDPEPRLRPAPRADGAATCGSASASTACCTRWTPCRRASSRP